MDLPVVPGNDVINFREGRLLDVTEEEIGTLLRKRLIHGETPIYNGVWTTPQALELSHREPQFDLYALFAGMAAISAMLLPGISGSYLLNILGMYAPASSAFPTCRPVL